MKILLCLGAVALVTACGPNSSNDASDTTTRTTTTVTTTTLTQANLDRISNDMSQAEVESILGQPTSSQSEPIPLVGGTQTTYNYQNGASAVTIVFKNNQVKQKSGSFGQ